MFGTPKGLLRRCLWVQTPTHKVFGRLGILHLFFEWGKKNIPNTPEPHTPAASALWARKPLNWWPCKTLRTWNGFVSLKERSVFFSYPKNPWTLQWKGLNLYSSNWGLQNSQFWGAGILRVLRLFSLGGKKSTREFFLLVFCFRWLNSSDLLEEK